MLPMPLISDWSSSARLTSVRRRSSRAAKAPGSKAGSSGSGAICAIGAGTAPARGTHMRWPNVRWSVKRRSGPPSAKVNRARTCGDSGRPGSPTSIWPLMPRCASSACPPCWPGPAGASSRASQRYLPLRSARWKRRPAIAAAKPGGPAGSRRTARGWSTRASATTRPTTKRSRPARTVSTSGSSGILAGPGLRRPRRGVRSRHRPFGMILFCRRLGLGGDRAPRRLGGQLFGCLLRAPLAVAEFPAPHPHHSAEQLLVVRAAVLHHVLGHAEPVGGGQLLQRGLPVEPGAEQRGALYDRVEEPVHERARRLKAAVDVRRADDRFERVGEDRRLVAAAGPLLAPAEPDVRA